MGVKGSGRKPKTIDWFLEKAKSIHTDENGSCKYDYSLVEYKNSKSKVKIICKEKGHGEFEIVVYSHLRGRGCPKCGKGGRKPNTTDWFIEKSNLVHGTGTYDYSNVDYINNRQKVCIGCKQGHGYFYQSPSSHMRGLGCRKCAVKSRMLTKDEFVEKAINIHGVDIYNYDKSIINGRRKNTEILCINCDKYFFQTPNNHINGSGCPICAHSSRLMIRRDTKEDFIKKSLNSHNGDIYDYSEVVYINSRTPVKIRCLKHDEIFEQIPNSHIMGQGCRKCAYERNGDRSRKTVDEFIQQAIKVHGDGKFDYSNVEYKSAHEPVLIVCSEGHENLQTPANHLKGAECRACKYAEKEGIYTFANAENNPEKYIQPCSFYRLRFTNKGNGNIFEKVGITIRTIEERFSHALKNGFDVETIYIHSGSLLECMELEEFILSEMKDSGMLYRVHDLKNTESAGWTECYYPKQWYN